MPIFTEVFPFSEEEETGPLGSTSLSGLWKVFFSVSSLLKTLWVKKVWKRQENFIGSHVPFSQARSHTNVYSKLH